MDQRRGSIGIDKVLTGIIGHPLLGGRIKDGQGSASKGIRIGRFIDGQNVGNDVNGRFCLARKGGGSNRHIITGNQELTLYQFGMVFRSGKDY
jgi:hypothetical protein